MLRRLEFALILFLLFSQIGCGHRKSPTGGEKDVVNPTILSITPDEFSDLNGKVIEIEFSKPIERTSITSGLRFYPEIFKKKIRWSKNTLIIQILEPLEKDTNYFLNISNRVKGEHGNNLDQSYIFIFSSGKIQENKISGFITYEENDDIGKSIKCRLSAADSTLIYTFDEVGENYLLENLNRNGHIIEAFIDHNSNGFYDYGEEPYFRNTVADTPVVTLNWEMSYEDTIKPFVKSSESVYSDQINISLSEEIESIDNFMIVTADSLQEEVPVIAFDKASSGTDKEKMVNILSNDLDTLRYYLVSENIKDLKGNLTKIDTIVIRGMAVVDTIGPEIISSYPRNGASLKKAKPEIRVVFNEIILVDNINATLTGLEDDRDIALDIVKSNSTILILKPVENLKNLSSYRLTLDVVDQKGNKLKEPLQLDFIVIQR